MPQAVIPAMVSTGIGVVAAGGIKAFTFGKLAAGWASVAASIATYSALGYAHLFICEAKIVVFFPFFNGAARQVRTILAIL